MPTRTNTVCSDCGERWSILFGVDNTVKIEDVELKKGEKAIRISLRKNKFVYLEISDAKNKTRVKYLTKCGCGDSLLPISPPSNDLNLTLDRFDERSTEHIQNRKGRFKLNCELTRCLSEKALDALFRKVYVLDVSYDFNFHASYVALSPHFDPIAYNAPIPQYETITSQTPAGDISIEWKRVN